MMFNFIKSKIIVPMYLNLDNSLGIFFFSNLNSFSTNLYNFFYKRIIFSKKKFSLTEKFLENGYQKIGKANINYINEIKLECEKQKPKKGESSTFRFKINEKIIQIIKKIILESCTKHIEEVEECYKSNIKLSWIGIVRNYNHTSEKEQYSNFFHTDGYNLSLLKMFINLQNINKDHGALQIVKNKYSKKFIRDFKMKGENGKISRLSWLCKSIFEMSHKIYKSRRIHNRRECEIPREMIYENLGEIGDILIADTTNVIHRAGIPSENHHRDLISLEFVALPYVIEREKNLFSLEKNYKGIYSDIDNWFSKKIAKPNGLRSLIKQFFRYKKYSDLI